jgi:DoxX-like family
MLPDLTLTPSRSIMWTGRIFSAIASVFLALDAAIKILHLAPAVTATVATGYPEALVVPIGLIEAACLILYVVPRTAVVGAVCDTLFPIYVAAMIWIGLWLCDRCASEHGAWRQVQRAAMLRQASPLTVDQRASQCERPAVIRFGCACAFVYSKPSWNRLPDARGCSRASS